MPKKPKKCQQCDLTTHGILCRNCELKRRKSMVSMTLKEYSKEWQRKKKYGLEIGEFDAYWIVFKGKCGICDIQMRLPENRKGQALDVVAIDHDHITGVVRGLLCNKCNKGLGFFDDNQDLLNSAIKWLSYHEKNGKR